MFLRVGEGVAPPPAPGRMDPAGRLFCSVADGKNFLENFKKNYCNMIAYMVIYTHRIY